LYLPEIEQVSEYTLNSDFFLPHSGLVQVCRAICPKDEGRSLGAAFQEEASNHPELLWLRVMVMSVRGKGMVNMSGMDQGDERK